MDAKTLEILDKLAEAVELLSVSTFAVANTLGEGPHVEGAKRANQICLDARAVIRGLKKAYDWPSGQPKTSHIVDLAESLKKAGLR